MQILAGSIRGVYMKAAHKIFLFIGAIFVFLGLFVSGVFFANRDVLGWFFLLPLIFLFVGIALLVSVLSYIGKNKRIIKNGKRICAKIYGYVEDTSITVNNSYPVNTVVRYFDASQKERETILETGFARGSNEYPLGMTIDIYELDGKFGYDKGSVRSETIPREEELMDNKPIITTGLEVVAIECKSCGASFCATKGYVSKCPYCGRAIEAE